MRSRIWFSLLLLLAILASLAPGALLAQGPEIPPEVEERAQAPGLDDVSWRYEFSSTSGTYTEITGGTVHGTASNDDQSFNAIDLGFTFNYDGVDYTQVSIQSNGFIAMGSSVASSYTPLSTGSTNNVVAAIGRDIEGNDTTSELMSKMEGTAPNRTFTIQWKHYRRYGSTYTGDDWNFQIKLYETSGLVEVVYGSFVFHDTALLSVQVGLRGASNADFNNRMTDSTHAWANSLRGTANTSAMDLSSTRYPASGLTYDWALATGVFLVPPSQSGAVCKGSDVTFNLTLANMTGVTTTFSLAYNAVWPVTGPSVSPELANGESWSFPVRVHIPWSANAGDQDTATVTATGGGDTAQATVTAIAGMLAGWQDVNTAAPHPVRAPSIVYWNGKLYKIGGYDGAAQAYLDIYDIATNTWSTGANMPGARYWLDCVAISAKIYCAGGYLTAGQTTLYIYDIATNVWSSGTAMSAYRYDYAGVAYNGIYYVIGGYGAAYQPTLWAYNPATNTWNYSLPSMVTGRRYASAGAIGGKIYVAGGYSPSYLNSVEVYDVALNSWSAGPSMPTTWLAAADAVKHNRYLVLAGGDDNSTATASNQGWILDTVTGIWSATPALPHQLYSAEADSDGTNMYIVSGRMYEGTYSYSPYTTLLLQCPTSCTGVTNPSFTWDPVPAITNFDVNFHATANGSPAFEYDWDFGDGNTGTGQNPVHVFTAAGSYLVELTVTNCDGANSATYSHLVDVYDPPTIDVQPPSLDVTHCADDVTVHQLEICNLGDLPLTWEVTEFTPSLGAATPRPTVPLAPAPAVPDERPVITSPEQCAQYANYAGVEPIGADKFCTPELATTTPLGSSPAAPDDWGYALDIGYVSDNFVTFPLNNFTGQTIIGTNAIPFYGMDFDPSGTTLYALNDTTDQLGTLDLTTGAFTALVPCPPPVDIWTGLSIDPNTGVFYASDATSLYTLDPATGNRTLVGAFGTSLMIDIAMGPNGDMYGHDIGTDSIYSINPATGVATLIGPTGYNANYAQGMDFDNDDGTLYIFLYQGSGANVYGTVNLATGAVTPISISAPQGEFEGATQTSALSPDIPWMSEVPTTGVVLPDECAVMDVTLDSTGMPDGVYLGGLLFESNDPNQPELTVLVTLTIGCPDIVVTPPSLSAEQCPDTLTTQPLTICNNGVVPLNWELGELTQTMALGHSDYPPMFADVTTIADAIPGGLPPAPAPLSGIDTWGNGTVLPGPARYRSAGLSDDCNNVWVLGGGAGGNGSVDNYMYDSTTDAWTTKANIPNAGQNWQAAEINGKIYLPGGYNGTHNNWLQIYDITGNSWSSGANMSTARTPMAAAWNGELYVFGGNPGPLNTVSRYNPTSNTWTDGLATMPLARAYGRAITWGNHIFVIGGTTASSTVANFDRYDPVANSWTSGPNMPSARSDPSVFIVGDYLYVTGGIEVFWTTVSNDVERYYLPSFPSGAWEVMTAAPQSFGAASAGCANDKMWSIGGYLQSGSYSNDNRWQDESLPCYGCGTPPQPPINVPWLSEEPVTGTIGIGACQVVDVTFDSTGLTPGLYTAGLRIVSDDPDTPTVTVPVTLTVNTLPDAVVTAPPLEAELCPSDTLTINFDLCNAGECILDWDIVELTQTFALAPTRPQVPPVSRSHPVELSLAGLPAGGITADAPVVNAPVTLVLDDGSAETSIGIGGTWEFIWLNRFTPDPGEFPFELNQVQLYFDSGGGAAVGDNIIIVVYENTSGDPDPAAGSTWLASFPTTVLVVDGWSVYDLDPVVVLNGPGDVAIGVITLETPGSAYFPAALDTTATQQRSWAGWWLSSPPPDPPLLPPDDTWGTIDSFGYPGNWMVRGYGQTIEPVDVPWLSEDPIQGSLPYSDCATIAVTFDSTGMAPGVYTAFLRILSNDPAEPEITLPVTLTVNEPVSIVDVTTVITDLTVAFTPNVAGTPPIDYLWDFGDGATSTETNPLHTYAAGGCYSVTLDVANGCGLDSWVGQVCVCDPVHDADFTWYPPTPIEGQTAYFTATAAGTGPLSYDWDLGDGTTATGQNVNHVYALAGTYTVVMTATGECGFQVVSYDITVASGCVAPDGVDFSWAPITPTAGATVDFAGTILTGTAPLSFDWAFSDGGTATGQNVSHVFVDPGSYAVTLTVSNDCGEVEVVHTVVVVGVCEQPTAAAFTWTPLSPFTGDLITFSGTATGTAPLAYAWDFDDGTTGSGATATHTYATAGDYTVAMTVTNGCGVATVTHVVTVVAPVTGWTVYLPVVFKNAAP